MLEEIHQSWGNNWLCDPVKMPAIFYLLNDNDNENRTNVAFCNWNRPKEEYVFEDLKGGNLRNREWLRRGWWGWSGDSRRKGQTRMKKTMFTELMTCPEVKILSNQRHGLLTKIRKGVGGWTKRLRVQYEQTGKSERKVKEVERS